MGSGLMADDRSWSDDGEGGRHVESREVRHSAGRRFGIAAAAKLDPLPGAQSVADHWR
jgi:hypothetical protein